MKYLAILFGIIIGAIIVLGLILTGFNILNIHLQESGFFQDLHRSVADRDEIDGFWRWSQMHYIFVCIESLLTGVYIVASIIFSSKYYSDYVD